MANNKSTGLSHEAIETNNFLMIVLILIVLLFGGLVEIVPLFFQKSTTQPIEGVKPLTALQLAGRDVYVREGCYNCHSQMIRIRWRVSRFTITHSSGAASALDLIWLVSVAATATNGTVFTCLIRVMSSPSPTCRPILGWASRRWMPRPCLHT